MLLSLRWLKEFIPNLKINDKVAESLTSLGLEVSSITKKQRDLIIDIDLTPNRGDCLSVHGIARDLNSLFNKKIKYPRVKKLSKINKKKYIKSLDSKICPSYSCLSITGLNNSIKTPDLIKSRLKSSGIKNINFLVDIINYVMLEIGQPMHVFDLNKLKLPLSVEFANKTELFEGLDDSEYKLTKKIPVISDQSGPIALAGVLGGKKTSTTQKTQNVLIESAFFEPNQIRQSSKSFRLQTDSSYRYERGVDPKLPMVALSRVLELLSEYTTYDSVFIDSKISKKSEKRNDKKITIEHDLITKSLGQDIEKVFILKIFKSLGFEIKVKNTAYTLISPSHRFDIRNQQDIIEEIARVYGYNNFKSNIPTNYIKTLDSNLNTSDILSESLSSRGYNEIISYTMLPKNSQNQLHNNSEIIRILNPISEDKSDLRASMVFNMLQIYKYNKSRQATSLRFYESGKIYSYNRGKKIIETNVLAGIIGGINFNNNLRNSRKKLNFFDLKGDLISVISNLSFKKTNKLNYLVSNTQMSLFQDNTFIGTFGALIPSLRDDYGISDEVFYFELMIDSIKVRNVVKYVDFSRFPKIKRDITLKINNKISIEEVIKCISKSSLKYMINSRISDIFYSMNHENSHKSLTIELIFQGNESTLSDQEVNEQMTILIKRLKDKLNIDIK